jgi:hypothetical protein
LQRTLRFPATGQCGSRRGWFADVLFGLGGREPALLIDDRD